MSADNYLYVRQLPNGEWTFTMEFASDAPRLLGTRGTGRYATWHEAYEAAEKQNQEDIWPTEYGIIVER